MKIKGVYYLFAVLAFISINVFGAVNSSQKKAANLYTVSTLQAASISDNPFHSNSESTPLPSENEDKDNVEEDEWNDSHSNLNSFLSKWGVSKSPIQTLNQFQLSLANREQLALFILYSSWKSFLS